MLPFLLASLVATAPAQVPEPKGSPEATVYAQILRQDSSTLVRKRAAKMLAKLGAEAREAIPAMLEAAFFDKDTEVRKIALDAVNEFTTPEKIEVLLEHLKNPGVDSARRKMICKVLPILNFHPKAGEAGQSAIYKGLEEMIADRDSELRIAAAEALELIDRRGSAVSRIFLVQLEGNVLRRLNSSAEDVQSAVRKRFPQAKVSMLKDTTLEIVVADAGISNLVIELESLLVSDRQGQQVFLREVATVEERATDGKVKKK